MNPFDLWISKLINGFAHHSFRFDKFAVFVSINNLLKGGVVLGLIWWLWFRDGGIRKRREILLAAVMASFPALAIARVLSWIFLRPRPLNETRFLFHVPYGASAAEWEGYNSFPSDHAVLFFGLAAGIFLVCRRAGWFSLAYVSIVICLPRIFIGEHYTTDILAGAAIGAGMTLLASYPPIRKPLTNWALAWHDSAPGLFYSLAFLVTYQMAELFDPILKMLKHARHMI